jgi:predicted DNA-binding transcriptional regulator YafY
MTSADLARELEVSVRTILRDIDAMTEAGLPIVVHRGNQGGIELGFNYRTRLTGLSADEAEALGVILARDPAEARALGLQGAAVRAKSKLIESLPDVVRLRVEAARQSHPVAAAPSLDDPRIAALAGAIRDGRFVTLAMRAPVRITLRPAYLGFDGVDWWVSEAGPAAPRHTRAVWGDINIARRLPPQHLG